MAEDPLKEFYQDIILDHAKQPRNFGLLENSTHSASGKNPICGDQYTVSLILKDDIIHDIRFSGAGCAISKAATSLMTQEVIDKPLSHAFYFQKLLHAALLDPVPQSTSPLHDSAALTGTRNYPDRIHCALLPWNILLSALSQ